jgi:hypothetical protein
MWLILIFLVVIAVVIGSSIYNKLNTKNEIEYYPNGRVKLKGVTKFNERIGVFEYYDENGQKKSDIRYENGIITKEIHYNPNSGQVWMEINGSKKEFNLKHAPAEVTSDYEFMLVQIEDNPSNFKYASSELKNNKEVVLKLVNSYYGSIIEHASDELKNDCEIVLAAIKSRGDHGYSLQYASDKLKNDPEIVLEAVRKYGLALQYASDELKNDREIVLEAVKRTGSALEYASDELKNDKEIVLEAIKSNKDAIQFASENLKNDPEILAFY